MISKDMKPLIEKDEKEIIYYKIEVIIQTFSDNEIKCLSIVIFTCINCVRIISGYKKLNKKTRLLAYKSVQTYYFQFLI